MKKNEVIKLPKEINEIVVSEGSQFTEAQEIAMNYAPLMEVVHEQMNKLAKVKLKKGKEPTPEQVQIARDVRVYLSSNVNGEVKRRKDADKELIKLKGNYIQSLHNAVLNASKLTQAEATEIEEWFDRIEAERKEELLNERTTMLLEFMEQEGIESLGTSLADMEESVFEAFLEGKKKQKAEIEEAERRAKEEEEKTQAKLKLHQERKEELLEYWQFLSQDQKDLDFSDLDKKKFDSVLSEAKRSFEQDQVRKKELEKKAEKQKKKDDQLDALQPYLYLVDNVSEKIGLADKEFDKVLAYLKKEDAKVKKEKAEKEEQERKEREKAAAAEEKERKEKEAAEAKLKAPDKEKLLGLAEELKNYDLPEVSDENYKKIIKAVKKHLIEIGNNIEKNI